MMPLVVAALLVGFLVIVVWLSKGGEKLVAARNAKLAAIAAARGLAVEPSDDPMLFAAAGSTPWGCGLRVRVDRVKAQAGGTRFVLRVVARPKRDRPHVLVRLRRRAEPLEEGGLTLHEVATGDAAFDERFVTSVASDAAAAPILARAVPALLALGSSPIDGVESLVCGAEVAIAVDCSFDAKLFEDGRAEAVVALALALAGDPSAP
jgi:hypothetical protein